jgi:hypothetical protein
MTNVNKIPQQFENVLAGEVSTNKNDDESYLLSEMLKKLVSYYGPSSLKTLNKIDCEYKFMTHSLPNHKERTTKIK